MIHIICIKSILYYQNCLVEYVIYTITKTRTEKQYGIIISHYHYRERNFLYLLNHQNLQDWFG